MTDPGEALCACCTFGDHTVRCTCPDRITKACCHPQNHFRDHLPDRSLVPELVGLREVVHLLELSQPRVWVLAKKPDFPKPVAQLRCGPIYLAEEVRAYKATRAKGRGGRPRKTVTTAPSA